MRGRTVERRKWMGVIDKGRKEERNKMTSTEKREQNVRERVHKERNKEREMSFDKGTIHC